MCAGIFFKVGGQEVRFLFPNPAARLPVSLRSEEVILLPWGRRKDQAGKLPLGGWSRLESIYTGRWDRWFPQPVKLPISSFMERDIEEQERWYPLTKGQWIQGLIARNKHEQRIYIVTIEPEHEDAVHDRWPRILTGS